MFALWFILGLSHSHPIIRIWLLFYLGSFWRNVNTLHSSGRRQISGAVIPIRPFSYKLLFKSCPSMPVVQWPPANNVGEKLECNGLNGDLSIFFSSMLVLQVLLRVSWNLSLVVYISLSLMSLVATLLLPYETKGRPMQVSASKCLPSCKNVRGISWVLLVLYELILRWNYPFSFSFFFLLGNVTKWLYLLRTP